MIKRITIAMTILLISSSMLELTSVRASGSIVKDSEKEIDKLESQKEDIAQEADLTKREIDELILEIDLLTSERKEMEKEIERNERRIKKIEDEIESIESEIDKLQDDIDERVEIVGDRLLAQQLHGVPDYLDVLVGSTSFIDFFTRIQVLSRILEADNEIIDDFFSDIEVVEDKLKDVQELRFKALEVKKKNIDREKDIAKNIKKTEKQKDELDLEIKNSESDLKRIKKEQDKLIEKINKELGMKVGMGEGELEWPTVNATYVSSGVGQRTHPKTGKKGTFHKGIDIARSDRSIVPPIYAADSGIITAARRAGGYGNMVKIKHNNGMETLYGHLSEIQVKVGQEVRRGQTIGIMGTTGMSTGIHLHFEVYEGGKLQNPLRYVK